MQVGEAMKGSVRDPGSPRRQASSVKMMAKQHAQEFDREGAQRAVQAVNMEARPGAPAAAHAGAGAAP